MKPHVSGLDHCHCSCSIWEPHDLSSQYAVRQEGFLQVINWGTKGKSLKIFQYGTSLLLWNYLIKGIIRVKLVLISCGFSHDLPVCEKWGSLKPGLLCPKLIQWVLFFKKIFLIDQDFNLLGILTLPLEFISKSSNSSKKSHEAYILIRYLPFSAYHDTIVFPDRMGLLPYSKLL